MLGFETLEEFELLARVAAIRPTIWARAGAPFGDLKELADYADTNLGEVRWSIQTGAPSHVQMIAVAVAIGASENIRPVHITGGGSSSRAALLSADVDIMGNNPTGIVRNDGGGARQPARHLRPNRNETIPEVSTLAEQGSRRVRRNSPAISGCAGRRRRLQTGAIDGGDEHQLSSARAKGTPG